MSYIMRIAYSLIFGLLSGVHLVSCMNINIITVIIGDNPIYGYYAQMPAMDIAFEHLSARFPSVTNRTKRITIYKPGNFACPDAAATMHPVLYEILQTLDHLEGYSVLLSPGCSPEIFVLGDLARELRVPLFATIAGDQLLTNRARYPTVLAYGPPDHPSLASAGAALLSRFGWTTVTMICDSLSHFQGLSGFYLTACRTFHARLGNPRGLQMDSKKTGTLDVNINRFLDMIKHQSRVVLLFTRPDIIRRIMVLAHFKKMTQGDYIFIAPMVTKVPTLGNITWQFFDEYDEIALDAYRSLIILNNLNADWQRISPLVDDIVTRTSRQYNKQLPPDYQQNDLTIAAYEVMESLLLVLDESLATGALQSGKGFSDLFLNRTFHLPSRSFFINARGMRTSDVILSRVNTTTGSFEEAWRYSALQNRLEERSRLADEWRGEKGPPVNRPNCGYSGDLCSIFDEWNEQNIALISSAAIIVLAIFCSLAASLMWRHHQYVRWWNVSSSAIHDIPVRNEFNMNDTSHHLSS